MEVHTKHLQTGALPARSARTWPVVAVLAGAIALQVLLAVASIDVLSSVRAYVAGESLYSKGQKDAQIHLLAYAESHRAEDYRLFRQALAVPLGDRQAREALQRTPPDLALARQGFSAGANDPDDIDGLIRLFRWFHRVPFMARAIATWTEGDQVIEQMLALVERARAHIEAGDANAPAVREMREQAPRLNQRLTELEREFSAQLGAASRQTKGLLLGLNLTLALGLAFAGLGFVRQSLRARAAAESDVRESQQRLARLVDTVADGVITIDPEDRVVMFNRAAEHMFGVPAAAAIGRPVGRFIAQHAGTADDRFVRESQRNHVDGRATRGLYELIGMRASGESFPMEASLSTLQTNQGNLVTAVLRDTSEQQAMREERKARAALEASSRAKTEFLSRMSHELRTPLNAVLGFAQLLRMDREHALSPVQQLRAQHIEQAGTHLLALVDDVLDLSRVESGRMSLSLEAVDLLAVSNEACAFVQPLADEAGIEIRRRFCERADAEHGDLWVVADRVRLRQVLVNLLGNAVKYGRPGGRVTLDCASRGGAIEYTVADDGAGMTAEQLAHLFEPFNRLGAERTVVEGSGIGLVLSRHLVNLMRGRLGIQSAPGAGTLATVRLERASAPAVRTPAAPFVPSVHGQLDGSLAVLYAEDNEVNVEIVRQVAAFRPAVRLRVAASGAEALAMAREDPPELMLIDMHLGDMTGLELARALRAAPVTAHVHLVALSADALPEQIRAALEEGFEGYLTKPVVFKELLRLLDGYIAA